MKIPLREYWKLLVIHLRPQWRRVVLLACLLFSTIALQLINPQIIRYFIDAALTGSDSQPLLLAALTYIGLALLTQVLSIWATYVSENVGWTATNALRSEMADHCLRLDMPFHNSRTPGQLIERLDGDITAMANFFSQFVLKVLGNLLLLVGVLLVFLREDWRLGMALVVFAAVGLYGLNRIRNIALPQTTAEREASAGLYGFLEERLAGTEDIRANGANAYIMRRLFEIMREFFHKTRKAEMTFSTIWITSSLLILISNLIVFVIGGNLLAGGAITLGTVYLFFQYTQLLHHPLEQMTRQLQDLQKASAGITRVQELKNTLSQIPDGGRARLDEGPLEVEFDRVSFGYNPAELILKDITFRLQPGKILGLLGRSGSGKTTTSRLLFRLYDLKQGSIRLNGTDLREASLSDLRRRVAMVTQEVQLFHATVRDNLTFFNPEITDEQIKAVIAELELGEWYANLPDGLDTELKAGGSGLSAAEAQLLAFTRVFLENPGLVILDEASSRLDPATEHLIERAVSKLLHNRTGIIIAHRLTTVQRADEIMIVEDGRIVEHAARERLANDPASRFYQLLQTGLEEALV